MQTIKLYIYEKPAIIPVLHAKQGDVGRKFKAIITDGTDGYTIPADANLSVWYSGTSGEGNYSVIDGRSAFAVSGNTVEVELITQMLNNKGDGKLCLVMTKADGTQIGMWNIPYVVEGIPGLGSKAAEQHYNALLEAQKNAKDAAARAEEAAAKFQTDKTLTEPEKPADAKAVGDALVWTKGKGEGSIQSELANAEADRALAHGNGAAALTTDSAAIGPGAVAGVMGFYVSYVEYGYKRLYLTTKPVRPYLVNTKPADTSYIDRSFKISDYFSVGDIIALQAKGYYHWLPNYSLTGSAQRFAIQSINDADNSITMVGYFAGSSSEDPNAETLLRIRGTEKWVANENGAYSDVTFHVSVPTKPDAGLVTLEQGSAFASGDNATAASGWATATGLDTMAYGLYSHAEGRRTKAGYAAHAEGYETHATGFQSHSEGNMTVASGHQSHAEGYTTKALGESSHSEGYKTQAVGFQSHSEGCETDASGHNSHAEGWKTKALGESSHSEGSETEATGKVSHAEGCVTKASGKISHAEGISTESSGDFSHAEGYKTRASGEKSHAEGSETEASGTGSHAEGCITSASGNFSHTEGFSNIAIGDGSHAEGFETTSSGAWSHTEGYHTTASGECAHAEGYANTASGKYAHVEGSENVASGKNSHAEGVVTEARGSTTHTEGMGTIATSNFSHVQGRYNEEDIEGKYAHIVGNGTISGTTVTRSNAHTIDWDGNAWFAGSVEGTEIIIKSPSGHRFRITVSDAGALVTTRIT